MRNVTRFLRRGQNVLGVVIVGFYVAVAIAAPVLAPRDGPNVQGAYRQVGPSYDHTPYPPGGQARLGTLPGQLDIYFTLVWGTRTSLWFGFVVAVSTAILGTLIGAVSGYLGGWVQKLTMPVVDAFLTFPSIAGYFLVQYVFFPLDPDTLFNSPLRILFSVFGMDPRSVMTPIQKLIELIHLEPLMLTLILFSWMPYARIINATTLRSRQVDYIQASRALGASKTRIIFRHLLPNIISPAIVLMARDFGGMVVLSAAFTFIGITGSSPWGAIIAVGRAWIIGPGGNPFVYWWTYVPATLALLFFGIGWNLIGDGLNSMLATRQAAFEQGPASIPSEMPVEVPA
jgi:peptide/nickel transport system permease protein